MTARPGKRKAKKKAKKKGKRNKGQQQDENSIRK